MTSARRDPALDARSRPAPVLLSAQQDAEDPAQWTGTVSVGGHAVRVTLGFGRFVPELVEYVDVSTPMWIHQPSLAAVAAAMSRIVAGGLRSLPLDLSDEIASADPPFPFRPLDDAKLFTAPDAEAVSVWLHGPPQAELTKAERYAIHRVPLSGAVGLTGWRR